MSDFYVKRQIVLALRNSTWGNLMMQLYWTEVISHIMIAKTFSLNSPYQNAAVALTPFTLVTLLFGGAFGHDTQRAHSMRFANYGIFFSFGLWGRNLMKPFFSPPLSSSPVCTLHTWVSRQSSPYQLTPTLL